MRPRSQSSPIVGYEDLPVSKTKDVTFYYIRYGTLPASITGHLRARFYIEKKIQIYGMGYLHNSRNAIPVVSKIHIYAEVEYMQCVIQFL